MEVAVSDGDAGGRGAGEQPRSRFKRLLDRFAASREELEAQELQEDAQEVGGTPIRRCQDREEVTVSGTLRTVTLRPRAGIPALEAELYDGSGTLAVVWLGRRQILGVEPGRNMVVHGRVSINDGRRVMFNPRYELRPVGGG
jgi:hypothetical protein